MTKWLLFVSGEDEVGMIRGLAGDHKGLIRFAVLSRDTPIFVGVEA